MKNSTGIILSGAIPIQPSGAASALLDTPDLRDDNGNNLRELQMVRRIVWLAV
jgi:hypothetical protein